MSEPGMPPHFVAATPQAIVRPGSPTGREPGDYR